MSDKHKTAGSDNSRKCRYCGAEIPDKDAAQKQIDTLLKFAEEFEPTHQAISDNGAVQVSEYEDVWHTYNNDVRPILVEAGRLTAE